MVNCKVKLNPYFGLPPPPQIKQDTRSYKDSSLIVEPRGRNTTTRPTTETQNMTPKQELSPPYKQVSHKSDASQSSESDNKMPGWFKEWLNQQNSSESTSVPPPHPPQGQPPYPPQGPLPSPWTPQWNLVPPTPHWFNPAYQPHCLV